MKTGILITAHSNQQQLMRLIDTLKSDFEIFVHLDKKCNIPVTFIHDEHVHVIKTREVFWGSFNLVKATLDLLELAYQYDCDYYITISGIDLPLKPGKEIVREIEKDPDRIYIDYGQLPREDWLLRGGFDRLQLYYDNWARGRYSLKNLFWILLRRTQRLLNLRRKLLPLTYYGGINWLNLSKEAVSYILEYLKSNPEYEKSFHRTLISDEIFFQTLLLNSPLAPKVVNSAKRYIDYDSGGPETPRTLRMKDLETILSTDAWFARKFNDQADAEVIEAIYLKTGGCHA